MTPITHPGYGQGFARLDGEREASTLRRGLIGYWDPSLGNTGASLYNYAPNGRPGQPVAKIATLAGNAAWDVVGSHCIEIPADGDYVDTNGMALPDAASWTVGGWARWAAAPAAFGYMLCENLNFANLIILRDPLHQITFQIAGSAPGASPPLPINTWHHLMMTLDGAIMRTYINGAFSNQQAAIAWIGMATNLWFGDRNAGLRGWIGHIGAQYAWDRPLRQDEILKLYTDPTILARSG